MKKKFKDLEERAKISSKLQKQNNNLQQTILNLEQELAFKDMELAKFKSLNSRESPVDIDTLNY